MKTGGLIGAKNCYHIEITSCARGLCCHSGRKFDDLTSSNRNAADQSEAQTYFPLN